MIDAATLKIAPTNDIKEAKNGTDRATMTLLMTKVVPTNRLKSVLLIGHGKPLFTASIMGVTIRAYLAMGLTNVVYIATFELSFAVGRFKVICD